MASGDYRNASLSARHRSLVICSVLGYPVGHPDAERDGYDLLVQARSGLMDEQLGYRDGPLDASRTKLVEPLELAGPNYRDVALVVATNTKPAKVRKAFAHRDKEFQSRME